MEPLTIKTPADVLSFVGHTLGFWPQESLVCITLDANRVGATLRVDLPTHEGGLRYARTVADYLAHDTSAASVLFAVYTSEPQKPGKPKPHAAIIAALTCALAERGMAQTHGGPQWSRVEWAQQLLLHAYTHSSTKHSAPILTAIAFVNWWEGRGSKAHQFLQLALEADPAYRLARLSDLMIGSGMVAGWNMDKDRAFRPWGLEAS